MLLTAPKQPKISLRWSFFTLGVRLRTLNLVGFGGSGVGARFLLDPDLDLDLLSRDRDLDLDLLLSLLPRDPDLERDRDLDLFLSSSFLPLSSSSGLSILEGSSFFSADLSLLLSASLPASAPVAAGSASSPGGGGSDPALSAALPSFPFDFEP